VKRQVWISVLVGSLFLSLGSTVLRAQSTAEISGTVRDQTGAVLPGVEVTATQTDTGVMRSTVTNETGSYALTNLALGPYRLGQACQVSALLCRPESCSRSTEAR
jgi:hypothetical protein